MLNRARSSWLLTALLVLGLLMPAGAMVSATCCCADFQAQAELGYPDEYPGPDEYSGVVPCCCVQSEPAGPRDEGPADESSDRCNDCDNLGACCMTGKVLVGMSALECASSYFDSGELARPVADRWTDAGPVFELVHPPRA